MENNKLVYTLDLTASNCKVSALVNGFPGYQLNARFATNFARPINSILIGNENVVSVLIEPTGNNPNGYSLNGAVKVYEKGEISSLEGGEVLLSIKQNELAAVYTFDNKDHSFRGTLLNADQPEENDALVSYAEKLISLVAREDIEGLLTEFKPKLREMALAYYEDERSTYSGFTNFMKNTFFPAKPIVHVLRHQIVCKPWCDKRIWELSLLTGENLLTTEANAENEEYTIRVFVGLVDGKLKVIR